MPTPIHKPTAPCLQPLAFGAMAKITAGQWTAPSLDVSVSAGTCSTRTRTALSRASTRGRARLLEGQANRGPKTPGARPDNKAVGQGQTWPEFQGLVHAWLRPPGSLTNTWTTTIAGILTAQSGPGAIPPTRRWSESSATSPAAVGPGSERHLGNTGAWPSWERGGARCDLVGNPRKWGSASVPVPVLALAWF